MANWCPEPIEGSLQLKEDWEELKVVGEVESMKHQVRSMKKVHFH